MADINDIDAAQTVKIVGSDATGVEQTPVSSTSDGRLRVESLPASGSSIIPSLGTNLYYDDMNVNSGGVARDTVISNTWVKVYDSNLAPTPGNSGLILGILITLESFGTTADKTWKFRLVVDGTEVYGPDGIASADLIFVDKYGMNNTNNTIIPDWGGFNPRQDTFRWDAPVNLPLRYTSGFQVYIQKVSEDRRFRAGLACLTKT